MCSTLRNRISLNLKYSEYIVTTHGESWRNEAYYFLVLMKLNFKTPFGFKLFLIKLGKVITLLLYIYISFPLSPQYPTSKITLHHFDINSHLSLHPPFPLLHYPPPYSSSTIVSPNLFILFYFLPFIPPLPLSDAAEI